MNTKEIWRSVPSLPGLLASSAGRLMVVPRIAVMPYGGTRQYGGEPTFGQWDGERFIHQFNGKTYKAHRLVCEAFSGTAPAGAVCMHLDEDASNNKPSNLAWGTQKQNLNAPGFLRYCSNRVGERSPTAIARARRAA